jgi:hypothetical protein
MKETLQRLEKLQSIDTRIASLKSEITELPRQLEATAATREAAREELKQTEERLEGLEHERRDLEGELPVENERLVKYKTQLNLIKNNKEYTAVLHEIAATEKKIGDLEEQILIKMEGIDAAKLNLSQMKAECGKKEESCDLEEKQLRARVVEAERVLGESEAERKLVAAELEGGVLGRYEQIHARRGGIAVVRARDGSCQGCQMGLQPQLYNELFKAAEILTCPSCQRILYVAPEDDETKP